MSKRLFLTVLVGIVCLLSTSRIYAHCEIPCGIYDDEMRFQMMGEHITTIKKSMQQVVELQGKKSVDYNQLIRWVMNKEDHANELQKIITQYFMTQRIKPDDSKYEKKLKLLHKMLIHAMKCKQTTNKDHVEKLRSLLKEFRKVYFKK